MSESEEPDQEPAKKGGKGGLILAVVALLLGAGGGFAGQRATMKPPVVEDHDTDKATSHDPVADAVKAHDLGEFIEIAPLVITLAGEGERRFIRMVITLEVAKGSADAVDHVMPRVLDVANSYLRALRISDLEERHVLSMIKQHLHTRLGLVLGEGRLKAILVQEFVVN